ncbi:ATP-dependent DNA helicase PIF6-like [Gordionus sp. m RMFG-2023]|uniref:ATP-dependent DNA helicase PIF6-like n=1 Tax=Gordionus sp. m RMFG-2023 TaxID=3053472 RepID=UPI0031FE150B
MSSLRHVIAASCHRADETITEKEATFYPIEFLNSLSISGLPPHKLLLKVRVPIILKRNLNSASGLNNGTKLIITYLLPNIIESEFVSDSFLSTKVLIPRISLIPIDSDLQFSFKRRQFPVRPAFGMTINKAQGQTLNKVGICLSHPVFSHGQLYVTISQVCSPHKLKIITNDKTRTTTNVVYREVIFD